MRNLTFRLARDGGSLRVSCPYSTSDAYLKEKIKLFFPKLIKKTQHVPEIEGDSLYIFGVHGEVAGFSSFSEEAKKKYLKGLLLPYLKESVAAYSSKMGIEEPYTVKVRVMTSRYGVNSKTTHSLTFASSLVHYDKSIIDSVVVHELAHYYYFDHSPSFYAVVYKYCPDYKVKHAKLRKHIYQ